EPAPSGTCSSVVPRSTKVPPSLTRSSIQTDSCPTTMRQCSGDSPGPVSASWASGAEPMTTRSRSSSSSSPARSPERMRSRRLGRVSAASGVHAVRDLFQGSVPHHLVSVRGFLVLLDDLVELLDDVCGALGRQVIDGLRRYEAHARVFDGIQSGDQLVTNLVVAVDSDHVSRFDGRELVLLAL